jgi:tetratricopeptide (TPR) repeat protein
MQPPNDDAQLCANCQKRPAVKTYSRGRFTDMVCASCFDRLSVQEAYEDKLIHIGDLARNGKYDDALACLGAILEGNRDRDHDGWLSRSIVAHRALILFQAGRYAESEEACKARAQLGFADAWERCEYAHGLANALEALGRDGEAVAVLEDALGHEDLGYLNAAPGLLTELVLLSEKLGQRVDPKWRPLAEAVAKEYAVEMPANDSFGQALRTLEELTRSAKPKRQREWEQEHGTDSDE